MKKLHAICIVLLGFCLIGCAVGNKFSYNNVDVDLKYKGSSKVAVGTYDQRKYIINHDKEPDFVGLQRGGYGNPFDVSTASEKPLATDITGDVTRSLKAKGFNAVPVVVKFSDSMHEVKDKLSDAHSDKSILITIYKWKSDTYQNTGLVYDLKLEVLDKSQNVIAQDTVSGDDDLRGSFWNPPAHARKVLPVALKEKLEQLLNNQQVVSALSK